MLLGGVAEGDGSSDLGGVVHAGLNPVTWKLYAEKGIRVCYLFASLVSDKPGVMIGL